MVSTRIIQRQAAPQAEHQLLQAGINPLLARLWSMRGVENQSMIKEGWKDLIPPQQLLHIEKAASILADAILGKQALLIIADYDCDGATACATALRGLRMLGAKVDFFVPNRFETGYGLSPAVIDVVCQNFNPLPKLIITVDNGIASIDGVKAAQAKGMEVLVTDHHLPADELPDALAIVNPNQPGCPFPSKNLAGVGVMFYVLMALRAELRQRGYFDDKPEPRLDSLSDLVALGTVADVVKLDANNRLLVNQGLQRIRKGLSNAGIQALFNIAACPTQTASSMDLGFKIGPRINAAGRLADMSLGIRCLISDNFEQALELAKELDQINRERRSIEEEMNQEALSAMEGNVNSDSACVCIYNEKWHQGVVGIVASRLKERFWKPTLAFAKADNGEIRGSGRSIPDVHLRDVLDLVSKRHPQLIIKFGGHAMAAGLSLYESDFDTFAQAFNQAVIDFSGKSHFEAELETDGQLTSDLLNVDNAILLQNEVWGAGFPAPLFTDWFTIKRQHILKDKHLKLVLEKDGNLINAIWFNQNELQNEQIQLVYEMAPNTWNGQTQLQLLIRQAF